MLETALQDCAFVRWPLPVTLRLQSGFLSHLCVAAGLWASGWEEGHPVVTLSLTFAGPPLYLEPPTPLLLRSALAANLGAAAPQRVHLGLSACSPVPLVP